MGKQVKDPIVIRFERQQENLSDKEIRRRIAHFKRHADPSDPYTWHRAAIVEWIDLRRAMFAKARSQPLSAWDVVFLEASAWAGTAWEALRRTQRADDVLSQLLNRAMQFEGVVVPVVRMNRAIARCEKTFERKKLVRERDKMLKGLLAPDGRGKKASLLPDYWTLTQLFVRCCDLVNLKRECVAGEKPVDFFEPALEIIYRSFWKAVPANRKSLKQIQDWSGWERAIGGKRAREGLSVPSIARELLGFVLGAQPTTIERALRRRAVPKSVWDLLGAWNRVCAPTERDWQELMRGYPIREDAAKEKRRTAPKGTSGR